TRPATGLRQSHDPVSRRELRADEQLPRHHPAHRQHESEPPPVLPARRGSARARLPLPLARSLGDQCGERSMSRALVGIMVMTLAGPGLGLRPESISFLRASDGRLGALWDRGWGRAGDREASSADAIVEALRAAFATTAPDTVVLPMPLDEHPDHRALHHFALLAMLAASPEAHPPEVLGYLIHGSRRWATASFDPAATG